MFLVLRYLGLPVAIVQSFGGNTVWFRSNTFCTAIYLFAVWGYLIFLVVIDLILILRVYAMYNGSRIALGILLLVYIPIMISEMVLIGIATNPKMYSSVSDVEVINMELCYVSYTTMGTELLTYTYILNITISGVLCSFALIQFTRDSLQARKALGKWQSNRYMKLLAQESILYFVAILLSDVAGMMSITTVFSETSQLVSGVPFTILPYILGPRLVLSVREFHSRTFGEHIDTGFGLHSQRSSTSHGIVFASPSERVPDGDAGAVEEVAVIVVE